MSLRFDLCEHVSIHRTLQLHFHLAAQDVLQRCESSEEEISTFIQTYSYTLIFCSKWRCTVKWNVTGTPINPLWIRYEWELLQACGLQGRYLSRSWAAEMKWRSNCLTGRRRWERARWLGDQTETGVGRGKWKKNEAQILCWAMKTQWDKGNLIQ